MRILNQQQREDETNLAEAAVFQRTSVDQLPSTTEIGPDDLMHIVKLSADGRAYNSKRIKMGDVQDKLYEAVQNSLYQYYGKTHRHESSDDYSEYEVPASLSWEDIVVYFNKKGKSSYIQELINEKPSNADGRGFVRHINYDFELLRRYTIVRTKEIEDRLARMEGEDSDDCMFTSKMTLTTTDENGNETAPTEKTENDSYCQMQIQEGNKISNAWTCPATGCLVAYGWVDSSKLLNNKAIPLAYCALEASINEKWEVIAVCPVIPAKTMTYVSFSVNVAKGLSIRARTGFPVGAKSGQYSQTQDGYDSPLANNIPNGFLCTVYSIKIGSGLEKE